MEPEYDEAFLLVQSLMSDPSSWLYAALVDWDYPVSREWLILADHFDLTHSAHSKRRPKPHPRPWPDTATRKVGAGSAVSATVLMERLRPDGVRLADVAGDQEKIHDEPDVKGRE